MRPFDDKEIVSLAGYLMGAKTSKQEQEIEVSATEV